MRVFSLVALLLGGFIGAGFASGREIANYFSLYQKYSNLSIILSCILLFLLLVVFLLLSGEFTSFKCFIDKYFGKVSWLVNLLFAGVLIIIISAMFAGTTALSDTLKINKFLVIIVTSLFTYFICLGNISLIDKINRFLVPLILAIIMYVCLQNFNVNFSGESSLVFSVISGFNYMFINIITLGMFIFEIGKKYTKKVKIWASVIVSMTICIVLLVFNNAIISRNLIDDLMPIITIAKDHNFIMQILIKITVWIALVTTLISNVYVLSNYMKNYIKNKHLNLLTIIVISSMLSMCGFDIIINYIYLFIGLIGFVIVLNVLLKEKETKIIVSSFKRNT